MSVASAGTITYNGQPIRWMLADALVELALDLEGRWPGVVVYSIGDAAHAAQGLPSFDAVTGKATGGTDHMPDVLGRVCAIDVMHGTGGIDAHALFDVLRTYPRPALSYLELEDVVPGRKIEAARDHGFVATDVGSSSAGPHCHVSVLHLPALADSRAPWIIEPPAPTPAPKPPEARMFTFDAPDGKTYLFDHGIYLMAPHEPTTLAVCGVPHFVLNQPQVDALTGLAARLH